MIFLRVFPIFFCGPLLGCPRSSGAPVHWTAWTPGSYATASNPVENLPSPGAGTDDRAVSTATPSACFNVGDFGDASCTFCFRPIYCTSYKFWRGKNSIVFLGSFK